MNKPLLDCLPILFVKEGASQFLVVFLLMKENPKKNSLDVIQ